MARRAARHLVILALLLKAVLAGHGAGLLPAAFVAAEIAERRLIKLADNTLIADFAYYLVYPKASHARPKVAAFREWILERAKADAVNVATVASELPDIQRPRPFRRLRS